MKTLQPNRRTKKGNHLVENEEEVDVWENEWIPHSDWWHYWVYYKKKTKFIGFDEEIEHEDDINFIEKIEDWWDIWKVWNCFHHTFYEIPKSAWLRFYRKLCMCHWCEKVLEIEDMKHFRKKNINYWKSSLCSSDCEKQYWLEGYVEIWYDD